ncbi:hypothetical protein WA026_014935 [Henosepilachna vigintioctopunctata]|uniref:Uncharacterized protein n=1 Tax=Henosepilachna vigintioctopunctata TaxID=420089 RepID=A0AAW1V081_9CUCU
MLWTLFHYYKMQEIECSSKTDTDNMAPYISKYESPMSSRSTSPCGPENFAKNDVQDCSKYVSDDEISVGCPSPISHSNCNDSRSRNHSADEEYANDCRCPTEPEVEDYFKPLKKLKMAEPDRQISPTMDVDEHSNSGVKSFSIADILNHKPAKTQPTRIVRPWDVDPELDAQQRLESFHRQLTVQKLALLRPEFAAFNASYASETASDRSSSVASDCCSPDIVSPTAQRQRPQGKQPGATPLDALFQMTSKRSIPVRGRVVQYFKDYNKVQQIQQDLRVIKGEDKKLPHLKISCYYTATDNEIMAAPIANIRKVRD